MTSWKRRLAVLALALAAPLAHAQDASSRPVRIVVPFAPGGGSDILARAIAGPLQKELGQNVFVENRAGASGNIGADSVARSAPDGTTLLFTAAPFAIAPALFPNLGFDPVKDFTPITQVAIVPLLVVTRPESPLNSLSDLVKMAREQGDKVTFASFGNGSPPHLVGESINQIAKIKMTHVPYKGSNAALADIISGNVTVAILDAVSMAPQVKSGRLKALAITGPKRSPALPDIPTLGQAGIAFDTVGWHAVFAPAGMDPAMTRRLNEAFNRVLALADIRERIVAGGSIPIEPALDAQQWAEQFRRDVQAWGDIASSSGARNE